MAGDWIKMRVCLWTHPKVVTLASRLSVTKTHALGALYCAWCIADQHADENGRIHMTPEALDLMCETPGLTAAMEAVGWAIRGESSLQFVAYQEHNGTTAKHRASGNKRQKLSRSRHGSVTVKRDKSVTREEKRREEKNNTPIPPELDSPRFREAWIGWEKHRSEKRKPLTPSARQMALKNLATIGQDRAIAAIEHSIAQGYQGIFEPSSNGSYSKSSGPSDADLAAKYGSSAKAVRHE